MKFALFVLLFTFFLWGCGGEQKKKFEHSGGSISIALNNAASSFIPQEVNDYYSVTVLSQVMEGLVGIDPKTTKIIPQIASDWTQSDDGKAYTFTIRDEVYFHPHKKFRNKKQRRLQTSDIISSIEKACKPNQKGMETQAYAMIYKNTLKGADEYYKGKAKAISGLKVQNNTITMELISEDHNFLYKLANVQASIMPSRIQNQGSESDLIGTGPFMYLSGDQTKLHLVRNEDYYLKDAEGNSLPYLDSLVFIFENNKLHQLDLFEEGKTDIIIGLPTTRITKMLEGRLKDFSSKPPKLILSDNNLLETNFYFFNMKDDRFKDPRVRLAFNYAVNKNEIDLNILQHQNNEMGVAGITPPISDALRGYDFESIRKSGFEFNPDKAKKLLAEAGYPDGKDFGTVTLRYNIDEIHSAVADEFSKQIYVVLGINVNIDGSTFEQLNQDYQDGKGDIFRMGWMADYPNPESFLMGFYGKYVPQDDNTPSRINHSRYKNPIFDSYFEQGRNATKLSDQMKYYSMAEIALLKDPPIIPLWYTGDIQISYSYVRNFYFNPLNLLNFREVYIKEWTEQEFREVHKTK